MTSVRQEANETSLRPDLVLGLVAPSGTDMPGIRSSLDRSLARYGYDYVDVSLSGLIAQFASLEAVPTEEYRRIQTLMEHGTQIREASARGDAIALLAVKEIRGIRRARAKDQAPCAFVLRSLKHPDEIRLLQDVYSPGFFTLSAFTPRAARLDNLTSRIVQSRDGRTTQARSAAEEILEKDESELDRALGQDVRDAFPLADYFLDCSHAGRLQPEVDRFVDLLFSYPFHTPSRDEYSMFQASAAALRSSDLGRQVGAVIADIEGDLVAVGCNEVPKFGGGLYWEGDESDERDFRIGRDPMAHQRDQIIREIVDRFGKAGLLAGDPGEVRESILSGAQSDALRGARVANLLEFGRTVHAEMAALMDAARRGVSVAGKAMYVTTFPCHLCARHIVAAGISRVVYIEPYPKSRAQEQHGDAITLEASPATTSRRGVDRVVFGPFAGVAPRQYMSMFEPVVKRRDANGIAINWRRPEMGMPRFSRYRSSYEAIEIKIVGEDLMELQERYAASVVRDQQSHSANGDPR